MDFIINRNDLNDVIDLCLKFVSKSSTLPILENIYIKANSDKVIFRATDMEKYINFSLKAEVKLEWSTTVNWKILSDILKNIESNEVSITKKNDNETLVLRSDSDEFKLNWISSSEYVAVPEIDASDSISFIAKQFVDWVNKVDYAITERNFSPIFTWILLRLRSSKLAFVWTDSFRLAEYKIDLSILDKSFDLIIPKVNISEIKRVVEYYINKWGEEITISFSNNLVSFSMNIEWFDIYITSILIQWNFPDYENENIMPTNFNTNLRIDKNTLEKAIKKVSIFTRDINNFIDVSISASSVNIDSWNTDKWQASTLIWAAIDWDEISFWINWKHILDFLWRLNSDEVDVNVVDNQKPVVFKDPRDWNLTYIIRPFVK